MSSFQSQWPRCQTTASPRRGSTYTTAPPRTAGPPCSVVPVCRKTMAATGGPFYPFALGIMNFSAQYRQLNEDYNTFFGIISNVNQSNASAVTAKLSSLTQNISQLARLDAGQPGLPHTPLRLRSPDLPPAWTISPRRSPPTTATRWGYASTPASTPPSWPARRRRSPRCSHSCSATARYSRPATPPRPRPQPT